MPNNYSPPPLEKGDVVLWYPEARKEEHHACPALVNYVAGNTVGLTAYRGGARPLFVDYCRHVDDPFLKDCDKALLDAGGWDYSPMMKRLMAVESALKDRPTSKRGGDKSGGS